MPMHYDSDFQGWIDDEVATPPPPQPPSYGLNGMDKFEQVRLRMKRTVNRFWGCVLMLPLAAYIVKFILTYAYLIPILISRLHIFPITENALLALAIFLAVFGLIIGYVNHD